MYPPTHPPLPSQADRKLLVENWLKCGVTPRPGAWTDQFCESGFLKRFSISSSWSIHMIDSCGSMTIIKSVDLCRESENSSNSGIDGETFDLAMYSSYQSLEIFSSFPHGGIQTLPEKTLYLYQEKHSKGERGGISKMKTWLQRWQRHLNNPFLKIIVCETTINW